MDKKFNELYENELTSDVGTFRFMAPEMKKQQEYTNKVDIYSCGALLYELFENKKFIDKLKITWFRTPKAIKNIIVNYMLVDNPDDTLYSLTLLRLIEKNNI